MKTNIGGERLGSGAKMNVDLKTFNRSTFDKSYAWRSTIGKGTLIPFMNELALPADTFDIDLDTAIYSNPLVGPLFGSDKLQLDVFQVPIRLYQAQVHNNKIGIGKDMYSVKLPTLTLSGSGHAEEVGARINPSSLFAYLGIRDIGSQIATAPETSYIVTREFNAVSYLAYFDIFKNYYAFKQQEKAYIIHTETDETLIEPNSISFSLQTRINGVPLDNPQLIPLDTSPASFLLNIGGKPRPGDTVLYSIGVTIPLNADVNYNDIYLRLEDGATLSLNSITSFIQDVEIGGERQIVFQSLTFKDTIRIIGAGINGVTNNVIVNIEPQLVPFDLKDIDDMREDILSKIKDTAPYNVNDSDIPVIKLPLQTRTWVNANDDPTNIVGSSAYTNEGILVKTYQSDIFNNYLDKESIDGAGGINEITAIDVSEGSFTVETLVLANKIYDMLNGIVMAGNTVDDWQKVLWQQDRIRSAETPIYCGGLIKEIVYDEVVSNSASNDEPLATLGGITRLGRKHKGGKIRIKVDEPSMIIGIVSITPHVDYCQGNEWHVNLKNYGEFHNPYLDGIGFQDLLVDQMNANATQHNGNVIQWNSVGKQPAWLNYMTGYNKTYGNFVIGGTEEYMVQNRKYGIEIDGGAEIKVPNADPYIDPKDHMYMFATQVTTAQPYWLQIGVGMKVRRKMSSKIMPKL